MIVEFKSIPEFFIKEKKCIKNNTVRTFNDDNDKRKILLDKFAKGKITELGILIYNTSPTPNQEMTFKKIRDVSIYNNIYIITFENLKN